MGIEPETSGLPLSGLIHQTTYSLYFFFISQKIGFDISRNGDSVHEMSSPVFLEK